MRLPGCQEAAQIKAVAGGDACEGSAMGMQRSGSGVKEAVQVKAVGAPATAGAHGQVVPDFGQQYLHLRDTATRVYITDSNNLCTSQPCLI